MRCVTVWGETGKRPRDTIVQPLIAICFSRAARESRAGHQACPIISASRGEGYGVINKKFRAFQKKEQPKMAQKITQGFRQPKRNPEQAGQLQKMIQSNAIP